MTNPRCVTCAYTLPSALVRFLLSGRVARPSVRSVARLLSSPTLVRTCGSPRRLAALCLGCQLEKIMQEEAVLDFTEELMNSWTKKPRSFHLLVPWISSVTMKKPPHLSTESDYYPLQQGFVLHAACPAGTVHAQLRRIRQGASYKRVPGDDSHYEVRTLPRPRTATHRPSYAAPGNCVRRQRSTLSSCHVIHNA